MTKQRKNNPKTTEIQPKNNRPKQAMRMRMKMKMKKRIRESLSYLLKKTLDKGML